jgi:hypothetical protein
LNPLNWFKGDGDDKKPSSRTTEPKPPKIKTGKLEKTYPYVYRKGSMPLPLRKCPMDEKCLITPTKGCRGCNKPCPSRWFASIEGLRRPSTLKNHIISHVQVSQYPNSLIRRVFFKARGGQHYPAKSLEEYVPPKDWIKEQKVIKDRKKLDHTLFRIRFRSPRWIG